MGQETESPDTTAALVMTAATNNETISRWLVAWRTLIPSLHVLILVAGCACILLSVSCKKVPHAVKQAKAATPTEKLVRELSASPVACSNSFLDAAVGLRDHLAGMQINLTVVLLPESEAVQRDESTPAGALPQTAWTKAGALVMDAE